MNESPDEYTSEATASELPAETSPESALPQDISPQPLELQKTGRTADAGSGKKSVGFRNIVAVTTLTLAGMGFSGASQSTENIPADHLMKETMQVKEESGSHEGELELQAKTYIKDLGMFAKMDLIKDIKEHANDIREILASGDFSGAQAQELLTSSGRNLKPILRIYLNGLAQLKQGDTANYRAAAAKLAGLVTKVETRSLSQLKHEFS
jgi:hypothetical protein